MKKITQVHGTGIVVAGSDIDTDQIIPARYMKGITFEGIEAYAFFDVRHDTEGNKNDHPFNDRKFKDASILIVNSNFGCGSSREHAPQTLMRSGIKLIVGESFAEIFAGNCTALGVPTVTLDKDFIVEIQNTVLENSQTQLSVDIEKQIMRVADKEYKINITQQVQKSLLDGSWDTTNVMMQNVSEIQKVYERLPYIK